jgi:hypothetical protein
LRAISCVAAPCSSTAAAIADEISERRSMVEEISLMAPTESWVAAWKPEIRVGGGIATARLSAGRGALLFDRPALSA